MALVEISEMQGTIFPTVQCLIEKFLLVGTLLYFLKVNLPIYCKILFSIWKLKMFMYFALLITNCCYIQMFTKKPNLHFLHISFTINILYLFKFLINYTILLFSSLQHRSLIELQNCDNVRCKRENLLHVFFENGF